MKSNYKDLVTKALIKKSATSKQLNSVIAAVHSLAAFRYSSVILLDRIDYYSVISVIKNPLSTDYDCEIIARIDSGISKRLAKIEDDSVEVWQNIYEEENRIYEQLFLDTCSESIATNGILN